MTTITIPISEPNLRRLQSLAKSAGVSAEELAQTQLEEGLAKSREEFLRIKEEVLTENAELYRRLA